MATEAVSNKDASGDSSYTSKLASSLNQFRNQGTFCDVTIVIDDHQFRAHKAVLSSDSSYFRGMFTSGFQESGRSEVTIQEGSAESFSQLLDFAYTGYFQLSVTNVCDILRMACYMDFNHAINICVKYAVDCYHGINLDDTFEIYYLAESHFLTNEVNVLRKHLLTNFLKLSESKTFLDHASQDFVLMCLSSQEIETDEPQEEEILQCTLNWLRHNWNQRKTHTADLLKKVRLGLVSSASLKQILGDEVLAIPECMKMVEEVINLHATKKSATVPLIESHRHMFATRNTITAPVFLEKQARGVCLHVRINKLCYKLSRSASLLAGTCPSNSLIILEHGNGLTLLSTGSHVYVAGGLGDEMAVAQVAHIPYIYLGNRQASDARCRPPSPRPGFFKYDPRSGLWVTLPPMPVGLAYPALVELDGYIYAMGSSSPSYIDCYDVLRYKIATRQWKQICPLPKDLKGMSAVALNGYVLVAGSCLKMRNVMSLFVLALNPKSCAWSVVYEANIPILESFPSFMRIPPLLHRCIRQYPVQIFMHNDMCYFQSIKCEDERYEVQVEEVIWDCEDENPIITLGEEVDQEATFGDLLTNEDVVNLSQMLTFDKNLARMSRMSQCSLPHNKEDPFMKALDMW
ncbi:kelch-like protein 15 [Amphiura filiformis]|uniref:kelch-like protein 15 n=1 Tax=Amphiura filiformis TaxID=82378 RepID=UPI003B21FD4B